MSVSPPAEATPRESSVGLLLSQVVKYGKLDLHDEFDIIAGIIRLKVQNAARFVCRLLLPFIRKASRFFPCAQCSCARTRRLQGRQFTERSSKSQPTLRLVPILQRLYLNSTHINCYSVYSKSPWILDLCIPSNT